MVRLEKTLVWSSRRTQEVSEERVAECNRSKARRRPKCVWCARGVPSPVPGLAVQPAADVTVRFAKKNTAATDKPA
jgi:hypothetical protein